MSKRTKGNLIAIGVLIACSIAIFILAQFENIAEWWATSFYRNFAYASLNIFGDLKWDFFEFFMLALSISTVILIGYAIYYFIHKKKDKGWDTITGMITMLLSVAFITITIMVPLYNRKPLNIKEQETLLSDEEAVAIVHKYFDDFNALVDSIDNSNSETNHYIQKNPEGRVIYVGGDETLKTSVQDAYKMLDNNEYFARVYARVKKMKFSSVMSWFSIAGISYLPSVEPGYNAQMVDYEKCLTMAHELAHTRGVMRENDANETAYFVLLNSDNLYLKYVGYMATYSYMIQVLKLTNQEVDYSIVPMAARLDKKDAKEFWDKNGVLSKAGEAINSLYLKLNSQSGTDSYISHSTYEEETIIDDQGNETIKYSVKSYSHVQNMIFALYI